MPFARNSFNKIKRLGRRQRKFVYSKKTYSNPFFRHRKAIARSSGLSANKIKLFIFALMVITIICLWLLFFSKLFEITEIEVSGVGDGQAKEIQALAKDLAENRLLGRNNLLLYNKNELSRILNEKYFLDNLIINKKLPHTLKIVLKEKQQIAVWYEDDKYFYLDNAGNIINQVDPLNVNRLSYPLIENLTDIKIED